MTSTAQSQLDTEALKMATIAKADTDRAFDLLTGHISICAKMQRAQLIGVISLLIMMLGVLVNLYVLPPRHTETTTTTTIIAPERK